MKNLPEELILEILLRLPVKSLLRFRSVSKSWLSVISNPQFAKSHFERSSMHTDRLIYMFDNEVRSVDFEASSHNDSSVVKLNLPLGVTADRIQVMGSCRGFLLLDDLENLFVWNPSTSFCKTLSYPPMSSKLIHSIYGFGYDSSTDDYLVFLGSFNVHLADVISHFELFSLKNHSWNEIKGTRFSYTNLVDYPKGGILLNGAVHWLVDNPDTFRVVILSFDLIEKNLRELPLPDEFEYDLDFREFGVHGGCLSLSIFNEGRTEIWMMKDNGVESSWFKSITISDYFSPICFTKGGDIVGIGGGDTGLIKCSHKGELLEQWPDVHWFEDTVAVYVESLLPLPSDIQRIEEGEDRPTKRIRRMES